MLEPKKAIRLKLPEIKNKILINNLNQEKQNQIKKLIQEGYEQEMKVVSKNIKIREHHIMISSFRIHL